MTNQSKTLGDVFDRSKKASCPLPRLLFSVLRSVDPYLQYLIIFGGYGSQIISKTGLVPSSAGQKGLILVGMSAGCAIKQILNATYILEEQFTFTTATSISIFNTISNCLSSLSSLVYGPSNDQLGIPQYVGITLFTVGILTELISELQRKRFKDDPNNQGKNYSGGLFSLARHINYGGYTLWRTGLALTSGNYWLAAIQFAFHTWDFTTRAVPCLTEHCSNKYGDHWKKYEQDVPRILFPFVW
jgi:protein-S-isoprenylcysteine O-methyltransferase Ste14